MPNPQEEAKSIYNEAHGALMAHSIRGTINYFYKKGIVLEVLIVRDRNGIVFKKEPKKPSFMATTFHGKIAPDPRERVLARIYLNRELKHHAARLCIAHELFHAILSLHSYIDGGRKKWDGTWKQEHEPACNKFAQELCKLHNAFNTDPAKVTNMLIFPPEIMGDDFVLDLSDLDLMPGCLKE